MTKKPLSPKHGKTLPHQKHIEDLAADDYVDSAEKDTYSDSDILAPQGVTVKSSENESRELGSMKTLAKDEEDEEEQRTKDLEARPFEWLAERAKKIGIPDWSHLQKADLVKRLAETSAPLS